MSGPRKRNLRVVTPNAGRVVLYVRVSSVRGRGGDDFHSPDIQQDGMRRLAAHSGLREVACVADDIDVSGQTFDRRGIIRIREMVELGQVDVVAVYKLSRVGRNLAESLMFIRWLREHGVSIISASEQIDDTPEGQFMLGMWLNLAELQGNQIGAEWARVIERRARAGKHHGRAPIGYRKVDGRMEVDPVLGPAVTAAFHGYAAGEPIGDVIRTFRQVQPTINRAQIKKMLYRPIYLGRISLHTATGVLDLPGEHAPLVDDDTWARVQRRLAADRFVTPRHLAPAYSLTGLLRCAVCDGSVVVVLTHRSRGRAEPRLACSRKSLDSRCAGIGWPRYEPVETAILEEAARYGQRLRGDPGAEAARIERTRAAGSSLRDLEPELERTRGAMTRLAERWARQQVPDGVFEATMARLAEAERDLLDRIGQAETQVDEPPPARTVALVEEMLALWPDMLPAEQNRALKTIVLSATLRRAIAPDEPAIDRLVDIRFRW